MSEEKDLEAREDDDGSDDIPPVDWEIIVKIREKRILHFYASDANPSGFGVTFLRDIPLLNQAYPHVVLVADYAQKMINLCSNDTASRIDKTGS